MSSVKDRIAMFQAMKTKQAVPPKFQAKRGNQPVTKKTQAKESQTLSSNSKPREENTKPKICLEMKSEFLQQAAQNNRNSAKFLQSKPQNSQAIEIPVIKVSDIKDKVQKIIQSAQKPKIVQESIKIPQQQIVYQRQEKRNPKDIKPIQGRQAKPTFQQNKQMLDTLFKQRQQKDLKVQKMAQSKPIQNKEFQYNQIPVQGFGAKQKNISENPKPRQNISQIRFTFEQETMKNCKKQEPRVCNPNLTESIVNHRISEQRSAHLVSMFFSKNRSQEMQAKRKQIMFLPKSEIFNEAQQPDNDINLQLRGKGKKKKPSSKNFDDL